MDIGWRRVAIARSGKARYAHNRYSRDMDPTTKREPCTDATLGAVPDRGALVETVTLLKGFADETRLRLLCLLRGSEVCVHDLVEALGISQSGVSHQLRILRDARLVTSRKDGRHVLYRLADEHVRELLENALSHGAEAFE